ncbi:MAG TPA: hypothetical protein VKG23_19680 [Thermoanaerobaculia bacterium]|nr:hypothetical protein [Thermoanaerobaculia bacterium]
MRLRTGFLALAALAVLVVAVVGVLETTSPGRTHVSHSAYRLGYQCARSEWAVAENNPNPQAASEGQFAAMTEACRRMAKKYGASFAKRSPFYRGFTNGFLHPP